MNVVIVSMLMMVVVIVMMMLLVVMVVMLMHVLIFFHAKRNYFRVGASDTALNAALKVICDIGNSQCVELVLAGLYVARQLGQRCQEHVACSAHVAFDIKSLHRLSSDVIDHAG